MARRLSVGCVARRALAALLFFAASCLICVRAQQASGTIRGKVVDSAGRPLVGIHVALLAADTGSKLAVSTTGPGGFCSFDHVAFGKYAVVLKLATPISRQVDLHGPDSEVDFTVSALARSRSSLAPEPGGMASPGPLSFTPSGMHGTIAPSGYSSGADNAETSQLRSSATELDASSAATLSEPIPNCELEQTLLHEVAVHPDRFASQHELGLLYLAHGAYARSIHHFLEAQRLRPSDAKNRRDLALAYLGSRQDAAALAILRPLADAHPHDASLLLLVAKTSADLGNADAARSAYRSAAEDARNPRDLLASGSGLIRLGFAADAASVLARGLRLYPQSAGMCEGLAIAREMLGQKLEAARLFLHALSFDPGLLLPWQFLPDLVGASPQMDQEIGSQLENFVVTHDDNAEAHYDYALALWRESSRHSGTTVSEIVVAQLKLAISHDPNDPHFHLLLAKVDEASGEREDAAAELQRCIALDPGNADAHYRLARLDQQLGHQDLATQQMKLFLAIKAGGRPMNSGPELILPSGAKRNELPHGGTTPCTSRHPPQ